MRKLANELGYSDVGLAKLCRRHQIPTPGLGYWRRVELGHKPARSPLPLVEQATPYRIELVLRDPVLSEGKAVPQEVPVIRVHSDRPISHPLARRSERLLKNARRDEKGLLCPRKGFASH